MDDLDIFARTLWGESEPKDEDDAIAIANVIMTRVAYPNWPSTPAAVCLQPWQFSCWNVNDPQRERLLAVGEADPWFVRCKAIAGSAMAGELDDQTKRSTHYYASYIKPPAWAKDKTPAYTNTHGRYQHLFFNDIDTPAPKTAAEALDQIRPLPQTRTFQAAQVQAAAGGLTALVGIAGNLGGIFERYGFYSVLALGLVALGAAVWVYWARLDDRQAGLR